MNRILTFTLFFMIAVSTVIQPSAQVNEFDDTAAQNFISDPEIYGASIGNVLPLSTEDEHRSPHKYLGFSTLDADQKGVSIIAFATDVGSASYSIAVDVSGYSKAAVFIESSSDNLTSGSLVDTTFKLFGKAGEIPGATNYFALKPSGGVSGATQTADQTTRGHRIYDIEHLDFIRGYFEKNTEGSDERIIIKAYNPPGQRNR